MRPVRGLTTGMTRIKMRTTLARLGGTLVVGKTYDLADDLAGTYVAAGLAERLDAEGGQDDDEKPTPEADRPPSKKQTRRRSRKQDAAPSDKV